MCEIIIDMELESEKEEEFSYDEKEEVRPLHYYGDIVRKLFFVAGLLLVVIIPIDRELLNFYLIFGIALIMVLIIVAGFTSPVHKWAIITDVVVSSLSFLFFEYVSLARFLELDSTVDGIFIFRQSLAIIFVFALYFATKTFRGMIERS